MPHFVFSSRATHRSFSLLARFLFSHTPTQNPFRTLESSHYLTHACVCLSGEGPVLTLAHSCLPLLPANAECPPVLSPTASTFILTTAV